MAYPFAQLPTFGSFRQRLVDEFDCRCYELEATINGARAWCLERTVDGQILRYGVTYDTDERLVPSVVRSICARLHVDVKEFGFTIG